MKNTFFVTAFFLLFASFAQAQFLDNTAKAEARQLSVKERAEWASQQMTQRYELSTEQAHAVKMAFLQRASAKPENRQTAFDAFQQSMQTTLNAEQMRKFKADQQQYQKAQLRTQTVDKALGNKQTAANTTRNDEWSEVLD